MSAETFPDRVGADFLDLATSPTHAGMRAAAIKCAEQIDALAAASDYGRSMTQALAELREWYRAADTVRGGKPDTGDPLAVMLEAIPLQSAPDEVAP